MKPIRIFLFKSLTTALFMAAYYKQENMRSTDIRDICIIHWNKALSDFSDLRGVKNKIFLDACIKVAGFITPEIILCPESDIAYIPMSIKNWHRDRIEKKSFLNTIKTLFAQNNIELCMVREVYHGNRTFHQYLKYLNPKIRMIGFEHGLSDTRNSLLRCQPIRKFVSTIKALAGKILFIFYACSEVDDQTVSLLAPSIIRVNKLDNVKPILARYVKEIANDFIKTDFIDKGFLDKDLCVGVILLGGTDQFIHREEDNIRFVLDLARNLSKVIKKIEPGINTIIFKPRVFDEFDEYFGKIKRDLARHFQGYNVIFLDDVTKTNFPIEFYLDAIRPKAIFAEGSSGLFYAKALIPDIETYTYHRYTMAWQKHYFGKFFFDYNWMSNIFFKVYKDTFKEILPKEIEMPFKITNNNQYDSIQES